MLEKKAATEKKYLNELLIAKENKQLEEVSSR